MGPLSAGDVVLVPFPFSDLSRSKFRPAGRRPGRRGRGDWLPCPINNRPLPRSVGDYGVSALTVWIDKRTFLVRRIDERTKFPDFHTEVATTYEPVIDEAVPETLLEFDPPKPK